MRGFCFLLNRFHWGVVAEPDTLVSALGCTRQEEVSEPDGAPEYEKQKGSDQHRTDQPPRQLRRNKWQDK